jgi:hypothetical protein
MLRDWEQGRTEPDQPARAYLTVIARDPEGVLRALQAPIPQGEERNRAGGGLKNGSFVRRARDDGQEFAARRRRPRLRKNVAVAKKIRLIV